MKIKYYLRGLGTGIIFTTIVLMIIYSYRTTDSKTIDRARELGMVMPEETSKKILTEDEKKTDNGSTEEKNSVSNAQNTTPDNEMNSSTQEKTSENDVNKEDDTTELSTDESGTNEPTSEESTTEKQIPSENEITFTVSGGMYSEIICQKLFELGVIDDAAGFNQYLMERGRSGSIKTGTYTLTTEMSYEDVAAIIAQ